MAENKYIRDLDELTNATVADADLLVLEDVSAGVTKAIQYKYLQPGRNYIASSTEGDHGVVTTGGISTILDLVTAIGTSAKAATLFRNSTTSTSYVIATALDLSTYSNVQFIFENGAMLAPATGITVTLPSPANIQAQPNQQIFSGAGTVAFSTKDAPGYAEWWGVDGAADEVEINKALTALYEVKLLDKTYTIADTITFKTNSVLKGVGRAETLIQANLTKACLSSISTSTRYYRVQIKNLTVDNTSIANVGGIGIDFTKITDSVVENVAISNAETGIKLSGSGTYYNKLEHNFLTTVTTGYLIEDTANENRIVGGKVGTSTTAIDVDGVSNTHIDSISLESFTTGIKVAKATATTFTNIISPRMESSVAGDTGIEIGANGSATFILNPYQSGLTTNISDSGTQTITIHNSYFSPWFRVAELRLGSVETGRASLTADASGAYIKNAASTAYHPIFGDSMTLGHVDHGGLGNLYQKTTELTLSGATTTWTDAIPLGATVLGVTARVTEAVVGAASWDCGESGGDTDLFLDGIDVVLDTTAYVANANAAFTGPKNYLNTTSILVTAVGGAGSFSAGKVRLVLYYFKAIAPTS